MLISSYKLIFGCAVLLTTLCSVTLVQISIHDCFPLYITECALRDYKIKCLHLHKEIPATLELELFCKNGGIIELLNGKYSMPAVSSLICSDKDKSLDCNGTRQCSCCTISEEVCSVDSNVLLDKMSNTCNNRTSCSVTVPNFQFKKNDCPTFSWQISHQPERHCDNTPDECNSRWIDVTYICHKADELTTPRIEDQPNGKGIDTDLTCPLSLGSKPTDLPFLGDDNWANFQVNFTFPCDGLIKQVWYHRSVPTVPVYLGIWYTKPNGNYVLKHKAKLQSDTLGLIRKVCEPAIEVKNGDFVGIHHTMEYRRSVISHEENQDSLLYPTLVIEVFDEDIMEGQELNLSGRQSKVVNKQFAIQLHIGFQTADSSIASTTYLNGMTGVLIGVTIAVVVIIAITIVIVIAFRKTNRKKSEVAELDGAIYLDTSNAYQHGTSPEGSTQEKNPYLTPVKQVVALYHPAGVYDDITDIIIIE